MDAKALRGWMLCQPRPVKLRIVREDEAPQILEIQQGMSYAAVSKSIAALEPSRVEALDKDAQLIRVYTAEEDEAEDDEEPETGYEVPTDGESQRLIVFAKLLADAYKHSTSTAFDKLGELFETVTRRSEALERTVDALNKVMMRKAIEEAAEVGAEGGDLGKELLGAFLSGQARAKAAEVVNNANGASPKGEA